jgi:NodT family efflux transporter outer membrane factor (OMF) lipoprotein
MMLTGCAVKRDRYDVPDIPIPAAYQKAVVEQVPLPTASGVAAPPGTDAAATRPEAKSADGRGEPGPPAVRLDQALPQWWRLLGSAELNSLIDRALSNNHDLRIANLRILQAKARSEQAVSDRLPVITAPAQAKREAPTGGVGSVSPGGEVRSRDVFQASLRGDWRVDVWGERQAMFESADLQLWRAMFQRDDVQRNLVASMVNSYIDYLSFNDRLEVARETDKAVSDMLETIVARLEKGDATVIDMEQQRAAVYSVKATIPALEQQRDEALNNLSVLLGAPPGSLKLSGKGLASLSYPKVVPGVPSALLLRRPDIRVMEARLLSADADLDVARTRLLPPLDLTAQAGYGSLFVSQLFESHTLFWNLIANLSATIFDYGKRNREVDFAKAVHEELVETYARVIYGAVREVDDALNAIQLTKQRLDAQRESADAARRSWEYSREAYQAGSVDHLLLLDTERTYHRNLDEQHNIDMLRYRALVSLFTALGGGMQTGATLPGKGNRPAAPAETYAGFAIVRQDNAVPARQSDGLALSVSLGSDPEDATWLVELPGVYDRPAIASTWRDLKTRFPDLMEQRFLLPRRKGTAESDGAGRAALYQVFLARFPTGGDAEAACARLRESQIRCKVLASSSMPSAGLANASGTDGTQRFLRLAPVLAQPPGSAAPAEQRFGYAVEIGRSGSREEAAVLAGAWKSKGYSAAVAAVTDEDGQQGFAIRMGPLPSEDQAAMLAQAFTEKEGKPARSVRVPFDPSRSTGTAGRSPGQ